MEVKQAKVVISVSEGRMEFEGSEEFVERQMTAYGDLIKESLRSNPVTMKEPAPSEPPREPEVKPDGPSARVGLGGYELLFAKNSQGRIQILKELPGSNKSKKMVNAALLLTLANTLDGKSATTFKEIRDLCKAHAALDSDNFAAAIKAELTNFMFEGDGVSKSISFTVPGKKAAEALAATLNL
jgi:hypothetical protein